ncbi:AP2/ERF domain [Dillenia turbinata]|uniref:AP2/ERF domain n=1 Tax=Dillenia turbinata TaxID=194707 RepID=A0AAN8ZR08_9MAGN
MNFQNDLSTTPEAMSPNKPKRNAGRKKFKETRHPIYKGVRKRNGKWVCELRQPHTSSRIWLGSFARPDMAARAHDVAAFALRGDTASLNFPNKACLLPRARSSSIGDIQCAAFEAAHADEIGTCSSSSFFDSSCAMSSEENFLEGSSRRVFLDEEELFNMPSLLDSMAEGMLITPPAMKKGYNWDGHVDDDMNLTLWSD